MTAQIGIFNKKAIALATDSAVTLMAGNRLKVFNTAEKLFELIPGVPIGIMIYNNSEFMSIPYEVLIKQYKKEVGNIRFDTLEEYNNSFLQFLRTNNFISEINEKAAIIQAAELYFHKIIDCTLEKIEEIQREKALTKEQMNEILMDKIKEYDEYLIEAGLHFELEDIYNSQELEDFKDEILEMIEDNAGILEEEQQQFALNTLLHAICSNDFHENYTGVVIAGYGENEVFAKSYETIIEFRFKGSLKYESVPITEVTVSKSAAIKAYAQSEMAETFIEGINPKVHELIDEMQKTYLCDLTENYEVIMSQYCEENNIELFPPSEDMKNVLAALGYAYYNTFKGKVDEIKDYTSRPFVAMVDSLDKLELAELAESLVNLTSLKRKVSLDAETVGGPIDVAIITKNEGFIWIKRKHYFDTSLNPFYNEKKRRELYGD